MEEAAEEFDQQAVPQDAVDGPTQRAAGASELPLLNQMGFLVLELLGAGCYSTLNRPSTALAIRPMIDRTRPARAKLINSTVRSAVPGSDQEPEMDLSPQGSANGATTMPRLWNSAAPAREGDTLDLN